MEIRRKSSNLLALPIEILLDVFSRLPTKTVLQVQCVSKTLYNLMNSPPFVAALRLQTRVMVLTKNITDSKLKTLKALKYGEDHVKPDSKARSDLKARSDSSDSSDSSDDSDSSDSSDDSDSSYSSDDSDDELVSKILFIERRFKAEFVACGLFCFVDTQKLGDPALLFNPLKGEVLRLPPSKVEGHDSKYEWWYGMGFDDVTNTFKVVRVSILANMCMVTQILVLGSSLWRLIPSKPSCNLVFPNRSVFAYGDMHWLISSFASYSATLILTFDFKKEEFIWTRHPNFPPNSMLHLLNLRGSLAIVDASISQIEIWALKNYDKKEWARDYIINVNMCPDYFKWEPSTCFIDAWEHGIFLKDDTWSSKDSIFFYDLRCGQMREMHFKTQIVNKNWTYPLPSLNIFSYTGSLISLKGYDGLRKAGEGETNFFNEVRKIRSRESYELVL